ncbi:hypothetical protein [Prosthecobacter sp.]|jgi:hypothetical protein|uniref:hypothetical protein n=1 Tax=Prosthecobacter sp. TaxID=1965333 RepID=UPI0037C57DF7
MIILVRNAAPFKAVPAWVQALAAGTQCHWLAHAFILEVEAAEAEEKKKAEPCSSSPNRNAPDDVLLRFINHAMRFVERREEAESS